MSITDILFSTAIIFSLMLRGTTLIGDGRAWKVAGRAQALIGPGLAMLLVSFLSLQLVSVKGCK